MEKHIDKKKDEVEDSVVSLYDLESPKKYRSQGNLKRLDYRSLNKLGLLDELSSKGDKGVDQFFNLEKYISNQRLLLKSQQKKMIMEDYFLDSFQKDLQRKSNSLKSLDFHLNIQSRKKSESTLESSKTKMTMKWSLGEIEGLKKTKIQNQ